MIISNEVSIMQLNVSFRSKYFSFNFDTIEEEYFCLTFRINGFHLVADTFTRNKAINCYLVFDPFVQEHKTPWPQPKAEIEYCEVFEDLPF
jgi:hypothetical protein